MAVRAKCRARFFSVSLPYSSGNGPRITLCAIETFNRCMPHSVPSATAHACTHCGMYAVLACLCTSARGVSARVCVARTCDVNFARRRAKRGITTCFILQERKTKHYTVMLCLPHILEAYMNRVFGFCISVWAGRTQRA